MDNFDLLHSPNDDYKEKQGRCFMLLLWSDNDDHIKVKERLDELDVDFVGILHDKDTGKPHWHIVLCYRNPKLLSTVGNALQLDYRWIRKNDSKKKAIQYLRHINHPDKYQYSNQELFGSLVEEAIKICSASAADVEASEVTCFINFLREYPFRLSYAEAIEKAIQLGCYSSLRRMGNLGVRLIKEHNEGKH